MKILHGTGRPGLSGPQRRSDPPVHEAILVDGNYGVKLKADQHLFVSSVFFFFFLVSLNRQGLEAFKVKNLS